MADTAEQLRVLTAGAAGVIREEELQERLAAGRPLRVKLGLDPTAADLHLGHAVVLRKLRQCQDLGHRAVVILGDYTARVGDPSGRSATRPPLSEAEIDAHAATYLDQLTRILDPDPERLEVRRNSEWLAPMTMADVLRLAARATVARMLERDDFKQRYESGSPISVTELLYPLMQGYDSVVVEADVELGGTDQLFNLLVGRQLQAQAGMPPQVVLTLPLLEGVDGVQKMSKSLGNSVGLADPPPEQFGKLYSLPDALMPTYFRLATGWHPDRVEQVLADLSSGVLPPQEAKRLLARTIVDAAHGPGAGARAEAEFDRVFKAQLPPSDVPEVHLPAAAFASGPVRVARLLALAGLVPSNAEGRRMIEQRGVRRDGTLVEDPDAEVDADGADGALVQVGKRRWARLRVDT